MPSWDGFAARHYAPSACACVAPPSAPATSPSPASLLAVVLCLYLHSIAAA
eukprot:CAMPEP_0181169992 /NCGR_PEP_ID=MMETSP1096-20121128/1117_1 /TAXON_ID=156174 ORGANISM="Chrysochromulina ericina, Strain CCMP281" /NCGR_SAMPLE_ID=MMETSP1096 /ASSEMBLY_ACC=CAM_ASM_000453 /LENGTH=50 /DNA_ID=CAMNT_0023257501 /DNA_START=770 /DNA_END=918 /DNA_ORIENTATION=-